MRHAAAAALLGLSLAGCATAPRSAAADHPPDARFPASATTHAPLTVRADARPAAPPDAGSDAPDDAVRSAAPFVDAPSYADALRTWRSAADVNAWIGARFRYDTARALRLSETQRGRLGPLAIHDPASFFAEPHGVCVDLARFGVETLRALEPETRPRYLMIEFDPVTIAGNTLRRHWVATFERSDGHYFFADSKRPGHVAGPYASTQDYLADYARYRGRTIVAFRERDSHARQQRVLAVRQSAADRP